MTSDDVKWTSGSSAYLRPQAGADAWSAEAQEQQKVGSQRLLGVSTARPPQAVRQRLALDERADAVLRERLILLDGRPVELARSWYPANIATHTALAEGRKIRGGAITLLSNLGHQICSATEDIESRLASADEASKLQVTEQDPVLVLIRVARDQDGQPVEMSVMVTPGSERQLRYEMKVD